MKRDRKERVTPATPSIKISIQFLQPWEMRLSYTWTISEEKEEKPLLAYEEPRTTSIEKIEVIYGEEEYKVPQTTA